MAPGNSLGFERSVSAPKSGVTELTYHPDQSTHVTEGCCLGAGLDSCALDQYLNYVSHMAVWACWFPGTPSHQEHKYSLVLQPVTTCPGPEVQQFASWLGFQGFWV